MTLERVLEDQGYTTATAVYHEEVSKMLSRGTFDLLVLDDYLSSRNAVQVLMELQDSRLKPLVVVTYHCVPSRDERAQLVAPHLVLVEQERDLRERYRAIDPPPRRESCRRQRGKAYAQLAEPDVLLLQRLGRIVTQHPVDVRELRIEGRAPEVGGDHRELAQQVSHVLVLEGRETLIAGMPHGQRLRRWRPRGSGAEGEQCEDTS